MGYVVVSPADLNDRICPPTLPCFSVLSIIPLRDSCRKAPPFNFFGMPNRSFCPEAFSAAGGAENALLPTCRSQMAAVRGFGRSAARFQQQAGALPVLTCRSPLSYTGI